MPQERNGESLELIRSRLCFSWCGLVWCDQALIVSPFLMETSQLNYRHGDNLTNILFREKIWWNSPRYSGARSEWWGRLPGRGEERAESSWLSTNRVHVRLQTSVTVSYWQTDTGTASYWAELPSTRTGQDWRRVQWCSRVAQWGSSDWFTSAVGHWLDYLNTTTTTSLSVCPLYVHTF